jgi:mono/diheme cytochrome c family protein
MLRVRRIFTGVLCALVLLLVCLFAFAWRPSIEAGLPPSKESFDRAQIRRGSELAALGDCATCHTALRGAILAGGRALPTPFGTIFSTNITPDPATGIGRWPLSAFRRAMREGVDREGRHLYPAFPYDHFTLVTDADNDALYAYLMTREPVHAVAPVNQLPFPLNVRETLAGWKLLFFRAGPYRSDSRHDPQWNRGAYLANGLAHCGACHTPRNALGAEKLDHLYAGGESDEWRAYAINSASRAHVAWTAAALYGYLRNGWHEFHGDANGPMFSVTRNLRSIPDADVRAIAHYIAWQLGATGENADPGAKETSRTVTSDSGNVDNVNPDSGIAAGTGAAIYASACALCHSGARPLPLGGIALSLSTSVSDASPTNIVNIIFGGLLAPEGETGAMMPGFASALTDEQMAFLVTYLRANFSDQPAWADVPKAVRDARRQLRD